MKYLFLRNPSTGKPDLMTTVVTTTTMAAVFRFLVDGMTINIGGYQVIFGHVDAVAYATLLAPVLGTHSWMQVKKAENKESSKEQE